MKCRSRVLMQLVALASMLVMSATAQGGASEPVMPEYAVKAEFIERFTRFVDWPPSTFGTSGASFVLCVLGTGPLAAELERVVARGRIKDRPAQLVRVGPKDGLEGCHILYVATTDRPAVRAVIARTRGKPILSVGDHPGLAEEGLLVNLFLDGGTFVRFEINREVAEASGLKISAKLMRLARLVVARR